MKWQHATPAPLRWLVALSALSLGLLAGQASAEPRDVISVKVTFADLDLNKQAGAETLYRRIQSAARSVCGRADAREIERRSEFRDCFDETVQAALKQVNRSSLYAVHNRRTGTRASG